MRLGRSMGIMGDGRAPWTGSWAAPSSPGGSAARAMENFGDGKAAARGGSVSQEPAPTIQPHGMLNRNGG